jgi:hypothetical protein
MLTLLTADLTLISRTAYYYCEVPLVGDKKLDGPFCFFYHSRISRSYSSAKLIVRLDVISN